MCLKKDANNLIGISIGGGAQYCPCLYIVQVGTEQFITTECYESVMFEVLLYDLNIRTHVTSQFMVNLIKWEVKCLCHWYLVNVASVVLQVFDNTPAALDGTLAAGDEITGVNGKPVKGKTKVEVAKMIQAVQVRQLWGLNQSLWLLTLITLVTLDLLFSPSTNLWIHSLDYDQ